MAAGGARDREPDPPSAEETDLLTHHPARNYGDLLGANSIRRDELVRRARGLLADAGQSPDYLSERTLESSEATDTPTYSSIDTTSEALQNYQMQLMLLEQSKKKRLLMARHEQDTIGLGHRSG